MLCSAYQQGGYYARCTRWDYWLDHLGCHHHCCTSPVGRRLAKPSEQPVQCWKTCCTGSGRAGRACAMFLPITGEATMRRGGGGIVAGMVIIIIIVFALRYLGIV